MEVLPIVYSRSVILSNLKIFRNLMLEGLFLRDNYLTVIV